MILELHRQGVSVSAIARRVELDRKTVRRYIAQGLEPPAYGPRQPRISLLRAFEPYLRERLAAFPQLTGRRLHRELRDLGYSGGYTILTDLLRENRPNEVSSFEVRFETPPGRQAQVDFAHFRTVFTDEPGVERIIWLFSLVLGHSRMLWGRFVLHQDLQTLLRSPDLRQLDQRVSIRYELKPFDEETVAAVAGDLRDDLRARNDQRAAQAGRAADSSLYRLGDHPGVRLRSGLALFSCRHRHGRGHVAHGSRRPDPLGNGRLSLELCADPGSFLGRGDLSPRRPVDHRHALAGAAARTGRCGLVGAESAAPIRPRRRRSPQASG